MKSFVFALPYSEKINFLWLIQAFHHVLPVEVHHYGLHLIQILSSMFI